MQETITKLSSFLPENVKLSCFQLLLNHYKDEKRLAADIGCSSYSLNRLKVKIDDKYFPRILSLALEHCPGSKNLLKEQVLDELSSLCSKAGILEQVEQQKDSKVSQLMKALDEKNKSMVLYLYRYCMY